LNRTQGEDVLEDVEQGNTEFIAHRWTRMALVDSTGTAIERMF